LISKFQICLARDLQVLAAAGIPPNADERRAADPENSRGYYEHSAAMRLHQETTWLPKARGKAVNTIGPLPPYLSAADRKIQVDPHALHAG
jgi:hypothetical protein